MLTQNQLISGPDNKLKKPEHFCSGFLKIVIKKEYYPFKLAFINSEFIRAIFSKEIPLGHSTSQAPVLVQLPNPSKSI